MKKQLVQEERDLLTAIEKETNVRPQIWAARSIAEVFDNLKIPYERTAKTDSHHLLLKTFTRTRTPCCKNDSQS